MISNFIRNFLEKIKAEDGLAHNTIISYQRDLNNFEEFLTSKKTKIDKAHEQNIKDYLHYLDNKKLKSSSIARKISTLKHFYKFLENEKLIEETPTNNLETPKRGLKLPKVLSEEEVFKLLNFANSDDSPQSLRMACMLEILYSAGLRVSELVSLEKNAIQKEEVGLRNYLIVRGKGNKERIAPLNKSALKILEKYLLQMPDLENSKYLFVGGKNTKSSADKHMTRQGFHKALKELAVKAGIDENKVHPHVIRHSFASHLLNNGVDLRILQELLGHSDISTTQIYTHILDSKLKELVFAHHPLSKK